jgi:hypothetical protein
VHDQRSRPKASIAPLHVGHRLLADTLRPVLLARGDLRLPTIHALAQRPGAGIAGVGERRTPEFEHLLVQALNSATGK